MGYDPLRSAPGREYEKSGLAEATLEPAAEPLDPAAVHSKVVDPDTRSGADVDHPLLPAEQELEVVHKADPGPAPRVEVTVLGRKDARPRGVRHQTPQPGESSVRILRGVERLDPVTAQPVVAAAPDFATFGGSESGGCEAELAGRSKRPQSRVEVAIGGRTRVRNGRWVGKSGGCGEGRGM